MEPEENSEEESEEELPEGSEVGSEEDEEDDSSEKEEKSSAVECGTPFLSCREFVAADQLTQHEDASEECVFELNPESDADAAYQNSKPGMLDAVIVDENSRKQETAYNSGKRRCSRWDQEPEEDGDTVEGDRKHKKRKTRWDSDDSQLRFKETLQMTNLGKGLSGSLLGLEVEALKKRLSEIKSILPPPEHNKLIKISRPRVRLRKKLIKERKWIIRELLEKDSTFEIGPKNKNVKFSKKLYIPVKEYPAYNFVGLLLGPKGNTQKRMEMETGAKIRLRGKGTCKTPQEADTSDDEDLHVFIEAGSRNSLDAAVCMVEKLLIPVEEGKNDHKRAQLQELSKLKEANLAYSCSLCNEPGHNHYACPKKCSTLKAACDRCGSFSHPTSGCLASSSNSKIKSKREKIASKLYVGHLPRTIDGSLLRELFSPFGAITQSNIVTDQITGYSKGYGFVKFDTPSAATLAIRHMNGYQVDGYRLAVTIAGAAPTTVSPAPSILPVYPGPAAIVSSSPVLPHYMLPEAEESFRMGGGLFLPPTSLHMEYIHQFPQTGAALTPVVTRSTDSRTAFLSTGSVSMFPGDPDYPGSGFQSYFTK